MYNRILIATDGSELAGKAIDHGLRLAKTVGAQVVFVSVTEMWSALDMAAEVQRGEQDAVKLYEEAMAGSAKAILEDAKAKADAAGVPARTVHVRDRHPAQGILETAETEDCDLIVMASHGRRGVQKMLIGSQTSEVVTLGTRPVLVLR
jgi:nucleotide-binding universal stress UspA family protein